MGIECQFGTAKPTIDLPNNVEDVHAVRGRGSFLLTNGLNKVHWALLERVSEVSRHTSALARWERVDGPLLLAASGGIEVNAPR